MPKSVSRAVLGRMQFTLNANRRTPHGALRLVQTMSAWLVKTRRAPSRHSRDARVYGHTTTAMHKPSTPPPPPPFLEGCSLPLNRLADHLTALRACLVQATSAWFVKTRHAPSRHSRDARVYGHTTTAMHKLSTPPRPPPSCGSSIHGVRADLSRRGANRGYNPPENRPDDAGIFYALFDDLVRLVCIGGKPGFMWFALTPAGGRSTEGNQNLRDFP